MAIAFSGYFLGQPATGSGQYSRGLLAALAPLLGDELVVFCPSRGAQEEAQRLMSGRGRCLLLEVPALGENWGKLWFEQVALPWACRHHHVELLHVPYLGPPLLKPCPVVVTIHDLIMLVLPRYRGSLLVRCYTALACAAARRADLILADSEATKRDVMGRLGIIEEARLQVVYLACDERFRPIPEAVGRSHLKARFGLEGEYILYLGGLDWRKNVAALIRAHRRLAGAPPLVIAGQAAARSGPLFPDLESVARQVGGEDRVRFLGAVDEEDKPSLYSRASVFAFPSLYEGFGLPPLEAMACGTPVVCSNAASLPEVVGDGALLFEPQDEEALDRALARALSDGGLRDALRRKGLERASRFQWRQTAEQTMAAYREVANREGKGAKQPVAGTERRPSPRP